MFQGITPVQDYQQISFEKESKKQNKTQQITQKEMKSHNIHHNFVISFYTVENMRTK